MSSLRAIGRAFAVVAAFAWIAFAGLILVLRYALLPNVDHYRGDLERIASRATGETVRIGSIATTWRGLRPSLSLGDVQVVDPTGGQALTLPAIRATLSWQTLLALQLRLASLEIDAPQLTVRRDADGQLYVAGFPIRKKAAPDDKAAEWLLAQDQVFIHGAQLVWRDEMDEAGSTRTAPRRDLVLTDITFGLVKSGFTHRAVLRAAPPATLAAPLDIRAVIEHPIFGTRNADPSEWSGEVYADVGTGDIVAWREWLPLPSTIDAGHGRVRVWMQFAGADAPAGSFARRLAERIKRPIPAALDRIASVTADLALDDVAVRWGAMAGAPEYSALRSIDGRLVGSQSMTEQRVAAIHMALQPRGGAHVAPTDFAMHRTIGPNLADESGEASLGAIDIAASLALVPEPLIPPAIAEKLAALKPRGALEKVTARWTGPIAMPVTFQGDIRFSRLGIAPQPPSPEAIAAAAREVVAANGLVRKGRAAFGPPGFDNLSGTITASRTAAVDNRPATTQATVALSGSDAVLNAPGLFDEPTLHLAHLAADIGVRIEGPDLEVKVGHGALDNPDLAATIELTFRHGPHSGGSGEGGGRGWLDLDARISRGEVGRIPRYLPNIIAERTRVYLKRALISGKISEATLRLRGPLERLNPREQPGALATPNPVGVQRAWMAVRDGTAQKTAPAATPTGDTIFHAFVKVHDATYLYGPGRQPGDPPPASGAPVSATAFIPWPAFEGVDADIVFDQAKMTVVARSARVYDYRLTDVVAELPALADPAHVLRVTGHGTGQLQDLVRFINNSPISRWLKRFTDSTRATRNASLALAFDLPLTHARDAEVAGSVQFDHNDLALNAIIPPISDINGRLDFSDRGPTINDLSARALGGPLRVTASTGRDGYIVFDANGTIDVAALQSNVRESNADGIVTPVSSAVDRAARVLSGHTDYTVTARLRSKRMAELSENGTERSPSETTQPDLVVRSDLTGLAIALPAPLSKSAAESLPLRIELSRDPAIAPATSDREDMRISIGDRIGVDIARMRNEQGSMAVTRAIYRVGDGATSGTSAGAGPSDVSIELPTLDADAWRAALKNIVSDVVPPRSAALETGDKGASGSFDNLLPARAHLKTGVLRAFGRDFTNVDVTAERMSAGWQADIAADQAAGHVAYSDVSGQTHTRNGVAPASTGKLVARLTRVVIPPSEASAAPVEQALNASKQTDFPSIDVVVDRFDLRGRTLGRLEVVAENVPASVDGANGREWQLEKLGLTMPEARFAASGVWGHDAEEGQLHDHTRLDFDIQASDVGALMDRFGLTRTISKGTAHLSGNAAWNGGPSTIDFGSMSGNIKLEADKGQFLKAEPGVAKLLNILSLQGLARRLTLDFSDVFSPGFAFDTVRADAKMDHGIATTDDFVMRGVQATVRMAGSADLEHETTKLHVIVQPQINAGAASLGVAVINPVVGLATFAAQYLFKDSITRALTFEYNVDGPWARPDVTKIDRNGKETRVVPRAPSATRGAANPDTDGKSDPLIH